MMHNSPAYQLTRKSIHKIAFGAIIGLAIIMAFWIKGFVLAGMFMGIMSTIGIWILVLKSPDSLKRWLAKHVLLSDLILSVTSFSLISMVGSGATVFMAAATQAVLLSLLLTTLKVPFEKD